VDAVEDGGGAGEGVPQLRGILDIRLDAFHQGMLGAGG
jgi:hypothetical protein